MRTTVLKGRVILNNWCIGNHEVPPKQIGFCQPPLHTIFRILYFFSLLSLLRFCLRKPIIARCQPGIVDLIAHPAVLVALGMAIMRAVRVLLMFYPEKRRAWGGVPNEMGIIRVLALIYVLMEITVWSAAAAYGIPW